MSNTGGREDYFAAAYALLGEHGYNGLTLPALCDRVGVTKGSFYHRFEDWPSFVEAFAACWQAWAANYFDGHALESDLRRGVELVSNSALVTMSPGARAMQGWARTNPTIASAMTSAQRTAASFGRSGFAAMAEDEDAGQVLGTMSISMCSGLLHRPRPVDQDHFLRLVERFFLGIGVSSHVLRLGGRPHLEVTGWHLRAVATNPAPTGRPPGPTVAGTADGEDGRTDGRANESHYFDAAWDLLAQQGSDGLTIAGLTGRLGLTKGSFRHHFGVLPTFVHQLAEEWERAETGALDKCLAERNPRRRLELLIADLLQAPPPATTAWQAWGTTNPVVAAALRRVHDHREHALALTLAQVLNSTDERMLAEITIAFALGLRRWDPPLDGALLGWAASEWMRRVVGLDAEVGADAGELTLAFRRARPARISRGG